MLIIKQDPFFPFLKHQKQHMKTTSLLTMAAVIVFLISCQSTEKEKNAMNSQTEKNRTVETIMNRRSIRSYLPEQIKPEQLDTILQCAINAPSALNKQPWEVRVIQNPELLEKINKGFVEYAAEKSLPGSASKAKEEGFSVFHGSPTLIVVAHDTLNSYSQVDCGLLGQNILLAAESMNIGTCVVGSLVAYFNTPEAKNSVISEFNFSENYQAIYTIAIGYKNEQPEAKSRERAKVRFIR
jgi:Nitroreductase